MTLRARRIARAIALGFLWWACAIGGIALGYTAYRGVTGQELDTIHYMMTRRWYVLGVGVPFWLVVSIAAYCLSSRRSEPEQS
jgi:cytochrome c biogenesis protein CcdA